MARMLITKKMIAMMTLMKRKKKLREKGKREKISRQMNSASTLLRLMSFQNLQETRLSRSLRVTLLISRLTR